MPPKRSLSPNSAAAHLTEAKRQALEEQRQRAEEWAKKFIKSPAPTPSATPSKKGRASVEADSHPFTEDVVEETPTRSRKRLSSKLPVSAESVGREKRSKNEEEVQKDDEQMSESELSTQRKSARARKSISANMPAIDEDDESDARVRSSSPHRPLTESSSDIGSAVSTPRRRRPFAIPEESLNAALNPPKLASATKKTVVPQSPAEASQTIHVPTSSQRRRQTLSSLPRDEDPVSSPAENSRATSSRRSSFASLTGSRGLSSLPETIKEETESVAPRSPISQQKDGARVSSEATVVATSSVHAAKDTLEIRPQMGPDSLTATVNNQDMGVEEHPSTVEIISKESQDTDSSTWDFLTPYLWIIIYIQLLIIVAVALYFADTRLVGITTVVHMASDEIVRYAGELASTFKYGFIPVDLTSSIKVRDASTEGGLERDALRLAAEAHFAAATSAEFREQQDKIMNDYLVSRGGTAGSFPGLSSAVEIVVLQLPTRDNGYIGVSMYCDQNGKLKNFELNTRATSLVQACGHANQIFGDTFIGRYYDNEEFPWERRDFDYPDMNSDATWVTEAYKRNQGRPSGAYSTSTVLQNMLNSNNTAVINDKAEPTKMARTAFTDDAVIDDHITWSQTGEEVELKLTLPTDTKKTDLAVKIQPKRLQIVVKSDPSLADTNPVFGAGAGLWGNIDSDCSAWTIEKSSTGKVVVVFTLAKANSVEWPKVFA